MPISRSALTLALLLAVAPAAASAQAVEWGGKAGLNRATWGGSGIVTAEARLGLIAGAFASIYFHPLFAVQPEVLYSMKGSAFEGGGERLTMEQDFLEIPILAKLGIPLEGGGSLRPSVFAGPALGFELKCDAVLDSESPMTRPCEDPELAGIPTTDWDLGLLFGLEARFALRSLNVGIEARYNVGFTNIDDREDSITEFKTRTFSFMGSLAF
jgi:hypothetical protein